MDKLVGNIVTWVIVAVVGFWVLAYAVIGLIWVKEKLGVPSHVLRYLCWAVTGALGMFGILSTQFSAPQSLALLVGAVWIAFVTKTVSEKSPVTFSPFLVRVYPNWHALLSDHGLISDHGPLDEGGWTELCKRARPSGWNVLWDGINFTVLGPTLYFSDDHKRFFTAIKIFAELPELRSTEEARWPFHNFVPQFYVKESFEYKERRHYWEFGLVTLESIQREGRHEFDQESKLVPVARLPQEFFIAKYGGEVSQRKLTAIDKRLEETGWKRGNRDREDYHFGIPFQLEHKYVVLRYAEMS